MTSDARRDPDLEARVTSTMALKKLGTPEDVAAQVVVLASDRLSGHVTGQVVVVAGGMEGRLVP
jgi:3-oxoacyl-[acyl-carrier protein] reductase